MDEEPKPELAPVNEAIARFEDSIVNKDNYDPEERARLFMVSAFAAQVAVKAFNESKKWHKYLLDQLDPSVSEKLRTIPTLTWQFLARRVPESIQPKKPHQTDLEVLKELNRHNDKAAEFKSVVSEETTPREE